MQWPTAKAEHATPPDNDDTGTVVDYDDDWLGDEGDTVTKTHFWTDSAGEKLWPLDKVCFQGTEHTVLALWIDRFDNTDMTIQRDSGTRPVRVNSRDLTKVTS
jgi:hypothetical protein